MIEKRHWQWFYRHLLRSRDDAVAFALQDLLYRDRDRWYQLQCSGVVAVEARWRSSELLRLWKRFRKIHAWVLAYTYARVWVFMCAHLHKHTYTHKLMLGGVGVPQYNDSPELKYWSKTDCSIHPPTHPSTHPLTHPSIHPSIRHLLCAYYVTGTFQDSLQNWSYLFLTRTLWEKNY